MTQQEQQAHQYGKSLLGKTAQSTVLTMISNSGEKVYEPSSKITAYEVVYHFGEHVVMVIISGVSVFEQTLFNIKQ
jgi:hypothetical protein